jgi:hypothetical protein
MASVTAIDDVGLQRVAYGVIAHAIKIERSVRDLSTPRLKVPAGRAPPERCAKGVKDKKGV